MTQESPGNTGAVLIFQLFDYLAELTVLCSCSICFVSVDMALKTIVVAYSAEYVIEYESSVAFKLDAYPFLINYSCFLSSLEVEVKVS